ncbi:lipopolysaccharide biosynthesis protein [Thalassiella azotivora]
MSGVDSPPGTGQEAPPTTRAVAGSFLGSVSWYAVGKLLPAVLTLLAVPVWLRLYGAADYGLYTVTWAVATLLSSVATGWLRQALLRYTGTSTHDLRGVPWWSWCLPVLACGTGAAGAAWWQVVDRGPGVVVAYVAVAGLFALTTAGYALLTALAQRHGEASRFAAAETARIAVALGVTVVLHVASDVPGATQIVAGHLVGTLVAVAVTYRRGRLGLGTPGSRAVASEFWTYGWPVGVWVALSTGMLYVDRLVLGAVASPEAVGQYAAVADVLIRGMAIVTFPVIVTVHPLVMGRWNAGDRDAALALARLWTVRVALALVAVVGLSAVVGPAALGVLTGVRADPVLVAVLAAAGGTWQLALLVHKPLELRRRTDLMLGIVVLSLALSLAVQLATAGAWGARGVAAGLAVGAVTYCAVAWWVGARGQGPRPRGTVAEGAA